jgi:hypothetical protein
MDGGDYKYEFIAFAISILLFAGIVPGRPMGAA